MSDMVFTHGPEFQRKILLLAMRDMRFCSKAVSYLKEDYFTGELKWFFRKIAEYYRDFRRPPDEFFLQNEVLKHGKESPKYDAERQKVMASELGDIDYLKRELTGFIRANVFVGAYRQAASFYNGGDKSRAYEVTGQAIKELLHIDFEKERVTTFGDHIVVNELASVQRKDSVPTGIIEIDEAMGGGMQPQSWTTFLGGSNVGKSMLGPNLAFAAWQRGKKTFITIHEDEEIPTKLRYLARFSGIPYNRVTQPRADWTQEERRAAEKADRDLAEFVTLRFMYGSECFIENVQEAVRHRKMEWDFSLFFCDYGQCLKSRAYGKMDDKYGLQEFIYQELKQICLELNIAGVGGAQVNRQAHKVNKSGTDFLRMTDVGDSWGICKKSSNVITMNRSDEDVKNNRIVFLLDKVRHGRCPVAIQCVTAYEACITYLPDIRYQQEIPVAQGPSPREDIE